ncbi:hypothetical protein L3Y34_001361 [Caenorhabditis briggsae]|uniref:Calponin-homology (CH) domain-containing protein n=1 Tax=Caenorhabditis briggsae TaxID=6238 RepID=A0AAE9DC92_CAEBR|nr:hypothetical protein L3Y34_001361 [Caenorhabditis briggsae]
MSIFTRPLNRLTKTSEVVPPMNEQNITHRKKLSTVSTSLQGDDGFVAASPRNCYTRSNIVPLRRRVYEEIDGAAMSSRSGSTPIEQKALEIRRTQSKKETVQHREESRALPTVLIEQNAVETNAKTKKSRPSTSSLASVFRSRASSPMETVRKVFGRSSSKQPKELTVPSPSSTSLEPVTSKNEQRLMEELEIVRNQLSQAQLQISEQNKKMRQVQTVCSSQQCEPLRMTDEATMTEKVAEKVDNMEKMDKENLHPDIICLESDVNVSSRIQSLKDEVAALKKENSEQKEDFRKTRKDFILILKEAVLRKDEAERKLETISRSVSDDDDWVTLMTQHKHTLRRNVLLGWVQKTLEQYSDQLTVSNFSSDWTDCRAFCALLFDLFPETMPDVTISPIVGDCVNRCRRSFQRLEIPFEKRALGIASTSSPGADSGADEDSSSACSVIAGLTDWRYIMNTVFVIYQRGVLGKT